jgi:hypothetical protein
MGAGNSGATTSELAIPLILIPPCKFL